MLLPPLRENASEQDFDNYNRQTILNDGSELVYARGGRVPILSGSRFIYVGCHRITREAWELLKKKVDGK
jgi:hypothetical protein